MKIFRIVILFCFSIIITSCITFEGQNSAYRYDKKNDRLLIFQVYENIFASGPAIASTNTSKTIQSEPSLTDDEKKELESVMKGQRTFFFSNWITEYNRENLIKDIRENKEKLQSAESTEKVQLEKSISLMEKLLASVFIKNGGFFFNDCGQLCGYQYVTVSNVSTLIPQVNKLISLYVESDLSKTNITGQLERERVNDAIRAENWVRLQGNQFHIMMVTEQDIDREHRRARENNEKDFLGDITNNLEITYQKPIGEITIGTSKQITTELFSPPSSSIRTNLVDHVEKTYGIKKKVPVNKLRNKFLRSGKIPE
jgi:hypothetical protein